MPLAKPALRTPLLILTPYLHSSQPEVGIEGGQNGGGSLNGREPRGADKVFAGRSVGTPAPLGCRETQSTPAGENAL